MDKQPKEVLWCPKCGTYFDLPDDYPSYGAFCPECPKGGVRGVLNVVRNPEYTVADELREQNLALSEENAKLRNHNERLLKLVQKLRDERNGAIQNTKSLSRHMDDVVRREREAQECLTGLRFYYHGIDAELRIAKARVLELEGNKPPVNIVEDKRMPEGTVAIVSKDTNGKVIDAIVVQGISNE